MIQKALTVNSQIFACGSPNIHFHLFIFAILIVFAQEIKIDANNSHKRKDTSIYCRGGKNVKSSQATYK